MNAFSCKCINEQNNKKCKGFSHNTHTASNLLRGKYKISNQKPTTFVTTTLETASTLPITSHPQTTDSTVSFPERQD